MSRTRDFRHRAARFAAGATLLGMLVAACSNSGPVTGTKGDATANGPQSETAADTARSGDTVRIVVAYNDETSDGNLITYTQSDRMVKSGASMMGWSYSEDGGQTWTYGGNVKPIKTFPILWGDPAIATSKTDYSVMFMSSLAVTKARFPASGVIDGGLGDYIGGACLAKSTNAGKTFAIYQCVSNTDALPDSPDGPKGHFYDGGSVVGSNTGEIFAAWVDVDTNQIDVYRAPNASGTFKRIAAPFPGLSVGSHPRMRTGPDGSLYIAAQVGPSNNGAVFMNRLVNGAWGKPVQVSNASIYYPDIDFGTTVQGAELTLRAGNQFSFDVGAASEDGNDAVRLLYVRQDANTQQLFIAATACSADLANCTDVPGWGTKGDKGPGGSLIDFYNPEVAAWRGFIGLPPTWQASWAYHYGKTATVNVSRLTLGYVNGTPLFIPVDIVKTTPVCSDARTGGGYWGDYDSMIQVGFHNTSTVWMRFLSDSSQGCTKRWFFTSQNVHVQEANYEY